MCMESTGVYWMPVFAALENAGGFDLWVVNAQHVKAVPGRKTDVKDAEWLAHLLRHGLLKKSFIPAKPFRELRDLTRYRRVLTEAQASERQRLIRLLELADIKLAGVMSDVFGVSGRAILKAIIEGGHTAFEMAKLARGALRKKRPQLAEALAVEMPAHQRQLLGIQLGRVEAAEAEIAALDKETAKRLEPYVKEMALLMTIPGIDWVVAAVIIAEIGTDLSSFPNADRLAAWGGMCPGNNDSAGKRKPAASRKGNPHLKTALCNAAIGASRKRGSYSKSKYHKLKAAGVAAGPPWPSARTYSSASTASSPPAPPTRTLEKTTPISAMQIEPPRAVSGASVRSASTLPLPPRNRTPGWL